MRAYNNPRSGRLPQATSSLMRVAIIAFAPIGINAGVLLAFLAMACFMGPILSMCCKKFGAVLAAIAHAISVVMLFGLFEVSGTSWSRGASRARCLA